MGRNNNSTPIHNLQRFNFICEILNTRIGVATPYKNIVEILNDRIDQNITIHQLYKDLLRLRWDFDLDYKRTNKGIFLESEFDFFEALKNRIS